jgi:hypothetical protein
VLEGLVEFYTHAAMDVDDRYNDGVWCEMEATGMVCRTQEARLAAQLDGLTTMSARVETVVRENETLAGDLDHHMALLASKADTLTGGSVPEEHQVCLCSLDVPRLRRGGLLHIPLVSSAHRRYVVRVVPPPLGLTLGPS